MLEELQLPQDATNDKVKQMLTDDEEYNGNTELVESFVCNQSQEVEGLTDLLELPQETLDTDDEDMDPFLILSPVCVLDTGHMADTV